MKNSQKSGTASLETSKKRTPKKTNPVLEAENLENYREAARPLDGPKPGNDPENLTPVVVLPSVPPVQLAIPMPEIEIIDKDNVLNSKGYISGFTHYPKPVDLFAEIIEIVRVSGLAPTVIISGEYPVKNLNHDNTENISYARLCLNVRYNMTEEYCYEVGFMVAFDMGTGKIRAYRGVKVFACQNGMISGADDITDFKITEGFKTEFVHSYFASVSAKILQAAETINRMKTTLIEPSAAVSLLGNCYLRTDKDKLKSGTSALLFGTTLLNDSKSEYYLHKEGFNMWRFYNAMTEYYAKKVSFFDIPEKVRDMYTLVN